MRIAYLAKVVKDDDNDEPFMINQSVEVKRNEAQGGKQVVMLHYNFII